MLKLNKTNSVLLNAEYLPSNNCDNRPTDVEIDTIILHCISLPEGNYSTDYVIDFFLNKLNLNAHSSFQKLKDIKVSSHIFIRRNGDIIQFVPFDLRAWHAGKSSFKGRENFNDFSIGIELEGTTTSVFEEIQYDILKNVIKTLKSSYTSIEDNNILGHSDISPDRKSDPGPFFNWNKIK
ncbi:MAG: 1,6-anhydro-N-acetylmuramyl-L-alanine amidase AmpD [Gammaproteobacteria bacterium]|nr:1,6-anhydro-N-acetylmuramyl-L-alanine amidase AmpD [Gammaproteobacteria bacterium]|tara:strand:- start:12 stop:551 length:540 start_codon:yes stop_codon:yes gene_type:complete